MARTLFACCLLLLMEDARCAGQPRFTERANPIASLDPPRRDEQLASLLRERFPDGVLRWGGDAEGAAPYEFRDPENPAHLVGFEVDLLDALTAHFSARSGLSLRAEFVQYDWVSLIPGLLKADFDLAASGVEFRKGLDGVRFSRPYCAYALQLVVQRDNRSIVTLADCRARSVGTMSGSAAERVLEAAGVGEIVSFDGQIEPYLDLELGRLDAVLLDTPIITYYALTNPNLVAVGPRRDVGFYALALRANDEPLASACDAAIAEMLRDGTLWRILYRWRLWDHEQARLAQTSAERLGLGFDDQGRPLPEAIGNSPRIDSESSLVETPVTQVDPHVVASAAERWTPADYGPLLLRAAGTTVFISTASMTGAVILGLVVVLARLYGPRPLQLLALGYVEFFRGIPLLLLLFFLYFGLASYGVDMPATRTAVLGFALTYAAYEAEIYRSSILAVPHGQWEAALALGMPETTAFRRVILPQAIRTALAPMTNDFVALFKDTSLVSVIAVRELTKEYLILSRSSLKFVELGLLTAALYLAMSVPLGLLSRWLERRWGTAT